MRVLLDTCVLLWYFEGSVSIPQGLRRTLTDPATEVFASDVNLLEIVLKPALGKLALPQAPSALLPRLLERHLIESLPLDREAIFRLECLPAQHRDPFDRLLVAQTSTRRLPIGTPAPLVRQYDVATIWG